MEEAKIVAVEFKKVDEFCGDAEIEVIATFDTGDVDHLFNYYTSELFFTKGELIGLTESEAFRLYLSKDAAYLNS